MTDSIPIVLTTSLLSKTNSSTAGRTYRACIEVLTPYGYTEHRIDPAHVILCCVIGPEQVDLLIDQLHLELLNTESPIVAVYTAMEFYVVGSTEDNESIQQFRLYQEVTGAAE